MRKIYALKNITADQRGFTLMALLVAVTVIGLTAGIAGSTWSSLVQRAKEEDLFWRGDQYRKAIKGYYEKGHGGAKLYPRELKHLLQDPRSLSAKRHIRQLYKDPMTGDDWELIKDKKSGRIMGVRSTSDKEPFRQQGFPEEYNSFAGAKSYSDWAFVYRPAGKNTQNQGNKAN